MATPSFNEFGADTSLTGRRQRYVRILRDHSLMRPRFLIALVESDRNAINRGHETVEQDDCEDAVRQHSYAILNDFGYEIRDVSGVTETALYSLVGTTDVITRGEVLERFAKGGVTADPEKLFRYLGTASWAS